MKHLTPFLLLFSLSLVACGAQNASIVDASSDDTDALTGGSKVAAEVIVKGSEATDMNYTVLATQTCKFNSSRDCWGSYQDFVTDANGIFDATFTVSLNANQLGSGVAAVTVNTALSATKGVPWTFSLFNNVSQAYDVLGDTSSFPDWKWTAGHFNAKGTLANYVSASGKVVVRLTANAVKEDATVDFLSVTVQTSTSTQTGTAGNGSTTSGSTTSSEGSTTGTVGGSTGGTTGGATGGTTGTTTGTTTGGTTGTVTGGTTMGGTTGSSGSACWWSPAPTQSWLWDLDDASVPVPSVSGAKVSNYNADVYDVDMFSSSAAQIATYHNAGKKVVCYIDVGSLEPGRPDVSNFDSSCYCGVGVSVKSDGSCNGNTHKMDGWNEWWFNLAGTCGTSVVNSLTPRFQQAAQKGCDAIEIDNIDAYDNSTGWTIAQSDEYAFVMGLAKVAHANCMGIIYKNSGGMLSNTSYGPSLVSTFDASLNEQCQQYQECDLYQGFVNAKKAAWNAEYTTLKCGAPAGMKTLGYDSTLAVEYKRLNLVCP